MKEQTAWSFSLGQWMGVQVRIHMFVLLFALISISFPWIVDQPTTLMQDMSLSAAVAFGWIVALLIHEAGHFLVAAHLGGDIRSATLFPWGSDFETSSAAGWTRFFVYLAGPAANLFAAAFLSVVLLAFRKDAPITPNFFNLLSPEDLVLNKSILDDFLRIAIWANWLVAVINLVPSFLFDGGFLCHSLMQAIRPQRPNQQLLLHCSLITQLFAVALLAVAVVAKSTGNSEVIPAWLGLALFGLVLMFASRAVPSQLSRPRRYASGVVRHQASALSVEQYEHFAHEDTERFIEFPSFEDDVDAESDESLSIWLKERQLERVEQAREREVEEERLADEILEKVHREGLASLSAEDRELLNRVSARYRNRQREEA